MDRGGSRYEKMSNEPNFGAQLSDFKEHPVLESDPIPVQKRNHVNLRRPVFGPACAGFANGGCRVGAQDGEPGFIVTDGHRIASG
jgi:hypothetical protein